MKRRNFPGRVKKRRKVALEMRLAVDKRLGEAIKEVRKDKELDKKAMRKQLRVLLVARQRNTQEIKTLKERVK